MADKSQGFGFDEDPQCIAEKIEITEVRAIGEGKRNVLPVTFFQHAESDRYHNSQEEEGGGIKGHFSFFPKIKREQDNRQNLHDLLCDREKKRGHPNTAGIDAGQFEQVPIKQEEQNTETDTSSPGCCPQPRRGRTGQSRSNPDEKGELEFNPEVMRLIEQQDQG